MMDEDTEWDPCIYVGDLQVRALMSYLKNEQLKVIDGPI